MKKLIVFSILIFSYLISFSQAGQIATLHHEDGIKTFYSGSAFKKAMAEAQPGDLITLSPGTFSAVNITIPVTVRGAGMGAVDSIQTSPLTILSGSYRVDIPENENGYVLSMEGLMNDQSVKLNKAYNAIFSKMKFTSITARDSNDESSVLDNITFLHCIFTDKLNYNLNDTFSLYNCVVKSQGNSGGKPAVIVFQNCVITVPGYTNDSGTYTNCIFAPIEKDEYVHDSAKAFNCLWVGEHSKYSDAFTKNNANPERNNKKFPTDKSAFKENTLYQLTDEAKAYLGTDGTEIGLYGGQTPFAIQTSYPQIKKLVVAPESTADGKLKIEIELNDAN